MLNREMATDNDEEAEGSGDTTPDISAFPKPVVVQTPLPVIKVVSRCISRKSDPPDNNAPVDMYVTYPINEMSGRHRDVIHDVLTIF